MASTALATPHNKAHSVIRVFFQGESRVKGQDVKIKKFEAKTLAVLGFLLTVSIPASAQWKDNMGGNWNNPTSASIGNIINDRLWARLRAKARARRKAGDTSPAATANEKQTAFYRNSDA